VELRCSYDPQTRGGNAPDGPMVEAPLHWVSAAHAVPAELRLYEHLLERSRPRAGTMSGGSSGRLPRTVP
jgi:glutaminyl-tRNA synthetase